MNAPTANPAPTTLKTSATDTVPPADFPTAERIDSFIRRQLSKVTSEDFSGIKSTADKAAALGFRSSANCRYAAFLEAFRSTPALAEHYAERYPQCCFLSHAALRETIHALDLWCDLPETYAGAVPPEQIPWMEIFEMDQSDAPDLLDFITTVRQDAMPDNQMRDMTRTIEKLRERMLGETLHQFENSMFVVAPKEAFITTEDWLSRARRMVMGYRTEITNPPPDPLVIRFVKGGALVIAAWGDEAEWINNAAAQLKLSR